jgi:hypothetical protein
MVQGNSGNEIRRAIANNNGGSANAKLMQHKFGCAIKPYTTHKIHNTTFHVLLQSCWRSYMFFDVCIVRRISLLFPGNAESS